MIKQSKAVIYWDYDDAGMINKVLVCDIDRSPAIAERYPSDAGAENPEWLAEDRPLDTPMGQFLWMSIHYGFANKEVTYDALRQFAQIEGQSWAQEALLCFGVKP